MTDQFRGLLYEISKGITSEKERALRGLLRNNEIKARPLEKCASPLEIFINLEESGQISSGNLGLLKHLLTVLELQKLAESVERFGTEHRSSSQQHCQSTVSPDAHVRTAETLDKQAVKALSAQGKGNPETKIRGLAEEGCEDGKEIKQSVGDIKEGVTQRDSCDDEQEPYGSHKQTHTAQQHKHNGQADVSVRNLLKPIKKMLQKRIDEATESQKQSNNILKVLEKQVYKQEDNIDEQVRKKINRAPSTMEVKEKLTRQLRETYDSMRESVDKERQRLQNAEWKLKTALSKVDVQMRNTDLNVLLWDRSRIQSEVQIAMELDTSFNMYFDVVAEFRPGLPFLEPSLGVFRFPAIPAVSLLFSEMPLEGLRIGQELFWCFEMKNYHGEPISDLTNVKATITDGDSQLHELDIQICNDGESVAAVTQINNSSAEDVSTDMVQMDESEVGDSITDVTQNDGHATVFRVNYKTRIEGRHELSVTIRNYNINGSPCIFNVIPSWNLTPIPCRIDMCLEDLQYSCAMKVDKSGYIVLADSDKNRLIVLHHDRIKKRDVILRKINFLPIDLAPFGDEWFVTNRDPMEPLIRVPPNTGKAGSFHNEKFSEVCGVAVNEKKGFLYISDAQKHTVFLYQCSPVRYLGYFGIKGTKPGLFNSPRYLTTNSRDQVIVADCGNDRIQVFTADGEFLFLFGGSGAEEGEFNGVGDVRVDRYDNIYACDTNNSRVQKFNSEGKFICCILTGVDDIKLPVHIEIPDGSPAEVLIYDKGDLRLIKQYTRACNADN